MHRLTLLLALLFLAGCATRLPPAVYQHDADGRVRIAHVGFNGMSFRLPAATSFAGPDATEALDQAFDFYVAFRLHTWKQNARPTDYYVYEAARFEGPDFSGAIIPVWIRGEGPTQVAPAPLDGRAGSRDIAGPERSATTLPALVAYRSGESFGAIPRDKRVDLIKALMQRAYYNETVHGGYTLSVPEPTSPRTYGRLTNAAKTEPDAFDEYMILGTDHEVYILILVSTPASRPSARQTAQAIIASMEFGAPGDAS